jgi:hypothetical protein
MRTIVTAIAFAAFGLAPTISSACEYMDDASAETGPAPTLVGTAPPAASKAPAPLIFKTSTQTPKQVATKPRSATPDAKVQKVSANTPD